MLKKSVFGFATSHGQADHFVHRMKVSRFPLTRLGRMVLAVALGGGLMASALAQTLPSVSTNLSQVSNPHQITAETVVLPKSVPDPIAVSYTHLRDHETRHE